MKESFATPMKLVHLAVEGCPSGSCASRRHLRYAELRFGRFRV